MTTPTMAERLHEALELARWLIGTSHEATALAYSAPQVTSRSQGTTVAGGTVQARGKR